MSLDPNQQIILKQLKKLGLLINFGHLPKRK